jgi:hypothetical protein
LQKNAINKIDVGKLGIESAAKTAASIPQGKIRYNPMVKQI